MRDLRTWVTANTWTPMGAPAGMRSRPAGFLLALVLVVAAVALTSVIEHSVPGFAFHGIAGFTAIVIATIMWGRAPGVVAAVANPLLLNLVVQPQGLNERYSDGSQVAGLVFSLLIGVVVTVTVGWLEVRRRDLVLERAELAAIVELTPDALTVWDRECRLLRSNSRSFHETGLTAGTFIARAIERLDMRTTKGEPLTSDTHPVVRVLRGEGAEVQEMSVAGAHGARRRVLLQVAALDDDKGRRLGAVALEHDITKSRADELERERLLEAEQRSRLDAEGALGRLRAVQTIADAAMSNLSTDSMVHELLARLVEVLAVDNAALLLVSDDGTALTVYMAHGSEEDVAGQVRIPLGQGIASRIASTNRPMVVENVAASDVANPFLKQAVRSLAGVPVTAGDRVIGVLHVGSATPRRFGDDDISLLRLVAERSAVALENSRLYGTEQRLRALAGADRDRLRQILDVLPEAVITYDADAVVMMMNRAAVDFLGESAVGKRVGEYSLKPRYLDGSPVALEQLPVMRALRQGEIVHGEQFILHNDATGSDHPVLLSAAPLRGPDGAIQGVAAIWQDISSLKEYEREHARILAIVSHDLKNPLTSISGMAQLLERNLVQLDEQIRSGFAEKIAAILAATARMTDQINDLMRQTRGPVDRPFTLLRTPMDIAALLRQIVSEFQLSTDHHEFRVHGLERPVTMAVDARSMHRAFANILANAVKYSPAGGSIDIRARPAGDASGAWIVIEIADHGIGIPSADLPHVFEDFYRGRNVEGIIEGSGLGLAGVRRVVEQHGGSVNIRSAVGAGTTVQVRLPMPISHSAEKS